MTEQSFRLAGKIKQVLTLGLITLSFLPFASKFILDPLASQPVPRQHILIEEQ
ncbi:hypothetical protein M408DRAFT_228852 [Serendipita vermifera MAFF 305830]|uniref:Uncharacterized protein n=1 Tax=Serendipita vermifera MAFF 305830 TaxID=933852 RepID=A0A0C3AJI0_SERVB|nr:hypothetical protein M408DRAFT_228852 [Serendipita vermifera MAFF 305830]